MRWAQAEHRADRRGEDDFAAARRTEIDRVGALQEDFGLDAIVPSEPERNGMVQYFAEKPDGFATRDYGWVQFYGPRCTRPPIFVRDDAPLSISADRIGPASADPRI